MFNALIITNLASSGFDPIMGELLELILQETVSWNLETASNLLYNGYKHHGQEANNHWTLNRKFRPNHCS